MKKALSIFAMAALMIIAASCNNNKHSKAFNDAKKILDKIIETVDKAETCEDLETAAWGMLGMLGVEGLDAIPEAEEQELTKLTDKLSALMEEKSAKLGCNEEMDEEPDYGDEVPFDEPGEAAE